MTKILDGKLVRDKIAEELKAEISRLRSKPKLTIIQVGDFAQSNTYIAQKIKFGEKIGATVNHIKLPKNVSQEKLISEIQNLNSDSSVHGIIVQLPIPNNLDKNAIVNSINPIKDVDGQTSTNIKLLFENSKDGYTPATTKGILTLLNYYKIPVAGKYVVVIGRSPLVGKPTVLAFLNRNATVTICHSKTRNLAQVTRNADILVVAAGKPKLITKEYVSKGQVVVDVGINVINNKVRPSTRSHLVKLETEVPSSKLAGDVDFESVSKIVAAISPVPGGAGPMTVASLFENLLAAYARQTFRN